MKIPDAPLDDDATGPAAEEQAGKRQPRRMLTTTATISAAGPDVCAPAPAKSGAAKGPKGVSLLRLARQVVDDARVRGDEEDGAAVVVAQVLHRHVSAEAERPAQAEHVLLRLGLRRRWETSERVTAMTAAQPQR